MKAVLPKSTVQGENCFANQLAAYLRLMAGSPEQIQSAEIIAHFR